MIQVTVFFSEENSQVEQVMAILKDLQNDYPHTIHKINIDRDTVLSEEFKGKSPVLDIGVYRLVKSFDEDDIRSAFDKVKERLQEAESKGNTALVKRITEPLAMTQSDRFSRWFSNHYMVLLNLFSFLYIILAILAPTLMEIGVQTPAKVIYKVYSPLCHQLAFRSFFLYGEQPYYPRDLAGVDGIITYGQATGFDENDINTARDFLGNETMGYKMALCQRDMAIYGAIFLFGILFSLTGKRIKPLPWYLWLIIGLGPIGLDGFSQLLSQTGLSIFNWLPLRESTPFLRSMTGAFFGLATAWFGFPYLEESVQENRREMQIKHAIVAQISEESDAN